MILNTGPLDTAAAPGIGRSLDWIQQRATTAIALWAADMALGYVSSLLLLGDSLRMDTDDNHRRRYTELAHELHALTVAGTYCADTELDYYDPEVTDV